MKAFAPLSALLGLVLLGWFSALTFIINLLTSVSVAAAPNIQPVGTDAAGPIPSHYLGGNTPPEYVPGKTQDGPPCPVPTNNHYGGDDGELQPVGTDTPGPIPSHYLGGNAPPEYVPGKTQDGPPCPGPTNNLNGGEEHTSPGDTPEGTQPAPHPVPTDGYN